MENCTDQLDKKEIHTLVGTYNDENQFITEDGKLYNCSTYRSIFRECTGKLIAVNLTWEESLKVWIIFQWVSLEEVVP
jgi:hypothetical protein